MGARCSAHRPAGKCPRAWGHVALQSTVQYSANSCADGPGAPASVWALSPGGCPHGVPPSLQGPALGLSLSVAGRTPAPRTAGRHPALPIEAPRPHGMGTPAPPCALHPAPLQEPRAGLAPSQEMPSACPRGWTPSAAPQGPGSSSSTCLWPAPRLGGERELLTGPRETPDVGHAGRPPAAGEGTAVRSLPLLPVPPPHVHLCPEGLPRARAEPLLGGLLSPKGDAGRGWGSGSQGQPWPHARYVGVQLGWCAQWGAGLQGGE